MVIWFSLNGAYIYINVCVWGKQQRKKKLSRGVHKVFSPLLFASSCNMQVLLVDSCRTIIYGLYFP